MSNKSVKKALAVGIPLLAILGIGLWAYLASDRMQKTDNQPALLSQSNGVSKDVASKDSQASDKGLPGTKSSSDRILHSGRDEGVTLYEEMQSVDSLPQERRWLSTNGSIAMKDVRSAFESQDFESMVQQLQDEALDNKHAAELLDVYSDYLRKEVDRLGGDQVLDQMACGVRTCVGQVLRSAGSEEDWVDFSRLGVTDNGPPVYLSIDAQIPLDGAELGFDPVAYRFFISTDPENRSLDISTGPFP